MSSNKQAAIPIGESTRAEIEVGRASTILAWQPDSPTLRFKGLLKVTQVGRSKAYELMREDPDFPQGIPLYDSERSPRFWWTDEVLAWVKKREERHLARRNHRKAVLA